MTRPSSRPRVQQEQPTPMLGSEPADRVSSPPASLRMPVPPTRHVTASKLLHGLWIAAAVPLVVEWLFPHARWLAYVAVVLFTVVAVPFTLVLVRSGGSGQALEGSSSGPSARQARFSRRLFQVGALLFLWGFLAGKWLVLVGDSESTEGFTAASRSYSLAIFLVLVLGLVSSRLRLSRFAAAVSNHPARLMALSFGSTGLLGALLLSLPFSAEEVTSISLVDNLFMAFSAVCVTGLAVNSVPETYSLFGQVVLCVLFQVGGLGIMVLSAAIAIITGQSLRVRSSAVLAEIVDTSSLASLRRIVLTICLCTLLIETVGAVILHWRFQAYPEVQTRVGGDMAGAGSVLWAAIFHSVSAFCNAGFSNFRGGAAPFVGDLGITTTFMALIILGGIGFPVLDELFRSAYLKIRRRRLPVLTLHTRMALKMSGILLGGTALAYLVLEWTQSMAGLPYEQRVTAALFHSVSARTAGFNVIDVGAMRPATLLLTCAAMFVGASPGSTGGGIKTTTLAALIAGLRAELGARTPHLGRRSLPDAVIRKAIGVAFLSLVLVITSFFLLLLFESHPPLELLFEVTSAFSTTGLSTGITPSLSVPGKLLVTLIMFIGRIGPLTLALAVATQAQARLVELPAERVMIG